MAIAYFQGFTGLMGLMGIQDAGLESCQQGNSSDQYLCALRNIQKTEEYYCAQGSEGDCVAAHGGQVTSVPTGAGGQTPGVVSSRAYQIAFYFSTSRGVGNVGLLLYPGDQWIVKISAPDYPNTPVYLNGGTDTGKYITTPILGKTDSAGNFTTSGTIGTADVGRWNLTYQVATQGAGTVSFTVGAASPTVSLPPTIANNSVQAANQNSATTGQPQPNVVSGTPTSASTNNPPINYTMAPVPAGNAGVNSVVNNTPNQVSTNAQSNGAQTQVGLVNTSVQASSVTESFLDMIARITHTVDTSSMITNPTVPGSQAGSGAPVVTGNGNPTAVGTGNQVIPSSGGNVAGTTIQSLGEGAKALISPSSWGDIFSSGDPLMIAGLVGVPLMLLFMFKGK